MNGRVGKKSGMFSIGLLCAAVAAAGLQPGQTAAADAAPKGPDLTGVVNDQTGDPLPGATVFIYSAGPKEGVGVLCPYCYPDCRKKETTDAQGRFKISDLDPSLIFHVLVVAKDHRPEFADKVDPAVNPITMTLLRNRGGTDPGRQARGRVLDPHGAPVEAAIVSIVGVTRANGSTQYGGNHDVDQLAVTDADGNFVINSQTNFEALTVRIEAHGFARSLVPTLATGAETHVITMTEGGSVTGRLVKDGRPVPGITIGICGADRISGNYVGDFSVATEENGKFLVPNLPPNRDYYLYAIASSLGDLGAVPARQIHVDGDGSTLDAGDVQIQPGLILAGQVRLTDGQPVPAKTRVLLGMDKAWDTLQTQADAQGHFHFSDVPSGTVNLFLRVPGYRMSEKNRSLDVLNGNNLLGTLTANKTNLVVELEPGSFDPQNHGEYIDVRQEPLAGTEGVTHGQDDVHITGIVVDAATGQPLENFTVTEGRPSGIPNDIQWMSSRQTAGNNGHFELFLRKTPSALAISVGADGYLPQASDLFNVAETNFIFALKSGSGPHGVVLNPDGWPLPGITVYLTDTRNGVYVSDSNMKVRQEIYRGTRQTTTDAGGKFSFSPRIDDYSVMILNDAGFANVLVEDLATNPGVQLQPWAKVDGRLLIGTRPGSNETVHLDMAYLPFLFYPRNFSPLSLFLSATTDADGHFSFPRVPPISVQIYHCPKVKDQPMGTIPVSQPSYLSLKPGDVKNITLGGQGRPVTGQVVLNGYDGKIDWRADVQSLQLILPPAPDMPDPVAMNRDLIAKIQAASPDQRQPLIDEMRKAQENSQIKQRDFYQTDKGRDYFFQNRQYVLNFSQDGSFRVEDVPGGKYRLVIDLRDGPDGPMRMSSPAIASLAKEVEIPDSPGGRSDEPFDLGKIELTAHSSLKAGKGAPDFTVRSLDGKSVKLSDFAGKYVLLDFWAVWCGPCVAETPYLKATYDAFKDNPNFRMIGLSLDPKIETPRDYAATNHLDWTIGFLGDWAKADLPDKYGVTGIPAIFLIGPDGKIIARDLRGEGIKAAVQRNLPIEHAATQR